MAEYIVNGSHGLREEMGEENTRKGKEEGQSGRKQRCPKRFFFFFYVYTSVGMITERMERVAG